MGARRQKTWAPRRRTGLGLGRWRCQRTTSTFSPKDDSDSTWARLEENQPRRLLARREGFLPAKNLSPSFSGCPRAPPWPIKGGPRQPRKGDQIQTKSAHKQGTSKKTGSALQADSFSLGLEVGERGDLPRAGSALLLPLAATLPGLVPRTPLVTRHHDDIYPDMQE